MLIATIVEQLRAFAQLTPTHPILVHFPVALLPVSVVADVAGKGMKRRSLSDAGFWCLVVATIVTPFTAISGWLWLRSMSDMDHSQKMLVHQWLGTALPVVLAALLVWRVRAFKNDVPPGASYIAGSLIVLLLATVQGHLGGLMSFGSEPKEGNHLAVMKPPEQQGHHHSEADTTRAVDSDGFGMSIHLNEKDSK